MKSIRFSRRTLSVAALAGALVASVMSAVPASAATSVPCSASGSHYNCEFYPAGDGISGGAPVKNAAGSTVGYLNQGTNYVYCEQTGGRETNSEGTNVWWAWTDANDGASGWVSALYASGGSDDGDFGGVPNCNNAHGATPGSGATTGPCGSDPGSGTAVTRWNNVVGCVLGMLGLPASDELVNDVDIVIQGESSGDPNAINLWDSNAQAGHPSTGLVQVIQPTFDTYHSGELANDIWDPAANIYAGMNYGIDTYGSIQQIPGVASVNGGGPYLPYVVHGTHGSK